MPSTYTGSGIELIANGEQSGTWGDTTNDNLEIIDRLTSQAGSISLSGTTHTLTISDGTLSDGQYGILVFGGSPTGTNTVTISPNDAKRIFIVKNDSGESVVLTQGSGGNVTIPDGQSGILYCDGGGAGAAVTDVSSMFNIALSNLATSTTDGDGDFFVVVDSSNNQYKLTKGNINISGFNNDAGYSTTTGTVTSVATGGGLTGGPVTSTGTISHADTSSQSSVNNSNGTVIQDVTLDTYGHVTALGSVDLDGRYYTETEADNRFVNVTGDTITGSLTINTNLTVDTNTLFVNSSTNRVGVGTTSPAAELDITGTGAVIVPVGTDAQRPGTGETGMLRYNSDQSSFEGYDGSSWGSIGGGGGGYFKGENGAVGDATTGPGDIFRINEQTLNTSTTIGAAENASCTGPLAVASGVTLTVTSGGNLSIV